MDLLAWAGNVSSSVLIIFVNKVLMNTTGYGFQYGELLALHLYIARCIIHLSLNSWLCPYCSPGKPSMTDVNLPSTYGSEPTFKTTLMRAIQSPGLWDFSIK